MSHFKKVLIFLVLYSTSFFAQIEVEEFYNSKDGLLSENINHIIQDDIGYLWIGTNKGLFRFDGNDFEKVNSKKINTLSYNNQKLYVGLDNGILIKSKYDEAFHQSKSVTQIKELNNTIFICTTQGISFFNNDHIQPIQTKPKLDIAYIYDITFYNDTYYMASNNGLWAIKNILKPEKEISLIYNDATFDVEYFNKSLLASTKYKILKVGVNAVNTFKSTKNINYLNKYNNLLWLNSKANGIEIYSLPSFSFQQKINKYNTLKTNKVNNIFKDNTNTFWVATEIGLYKLKTNETQKQTKPIIHIEEFKVNYKNANNLLKVIKRKEFASNQNSVSFTYKTVDFNEPKNILYRYRLNGKFSNWSRNNNLELVNLNFGKYDLEFQSKINNRKSDLKKIHFSIAAPFYYNVYYILGALILLIILLYGFVDFRIKNIKKKNIEKVNQLKLENTLLSLKQKALQLQMNPHFIFNVLNGIKALGNSGNTEELNLAISQFSNLLRSILLHSTKDEIHLDEEIISIKNYLELEKRISSKPFEYEISINLDEIDTEEVLIPTMLLQPFIENSIKHGLSINKKGLIKVFIDLNKEFINFTIIDNGIGYTISKAKKDQETHKSMALDITIKRLRSLTTKNNFTIKDIKEKNLIKGTQVHFKIPLKTDF